MRLDKLIATVTPLSRSQVRQALRAGRITVDGVAVREAGLAVTAGQSVCLDDSAVDWPAHRYLMLHKPAGVVCSTDDPDHPTVLDVLPAALRGGLHPVGRLDLDATGLVLLTDDGQWSHGVTSPRRHCDKVYRVRVADDLDTAWVARFAEGILLHGETRPTEPADLRILAVRDARVTVREGRYHQVKRMFAAMGTRVESLHRESIGPIMLEDALAPGQWRPLTPTEIEALRR